MRVKSQEDINIEKEIEKKPIFSLKNILLFIGQLIVFCVIITLLVIYDKMPVGNLKNLSPINIAAVQTSISLLSITIMQLILPDRKEKIFGVTYQNILFKWKVFRYLNALDCTMYMLLLMMINISISIASIIIISTTIQIICKAIFLLVLFESFFLAIYMVYLGLICKFKKSRIYYLLYKRMCQGNSDVYNMLLKGMRENTFESQDDNKEYIKVEVAMLEYMSIHIDNFKLYNICNDSAIEIIQEEKEQRNSILNRFMEKSDMRLCR